MRSPGSGSTTPVKLIYADYYGAAMELVKNPARFGEYGPG